MKPSIHEAYISPAKTGEWPQACGRMEAMLSSVAFDAIFALAWEVYQGTPDSEASDQLGKIAENAIAGLPADSWSRRRLLNLIYGKPLYS